MATRVNYSRCRVGGYSFDLVNLVDYLSNNHSKLVLLGHTAIKAIKEEQLTKDKIKSEIGNTEELEIYHFRIHSECTKEIYDNLTRMFPMIKFSPDVIIPM